MSLFNKNFKPLKTPSYILRMMVIVVFMFCLFLLSCPFFSVQFGTKPNIDHKATQQEIDIETQQLQQAFDKLVKKDDAEEKAKEPWEMPTIQREWYYTNVEESTDITKLTELITKAMDVDSTLYTEESYKALKNEILDAQQLLGTNVKISQTALQMVFCGNIAQQYISDPDNNTGGGLMYILFIVFPALGFFINIFDSKRHIKNVATLICSSLSIVNIFICVSISYLDIGSLLSIFAYLLLIILGFAGMYAKQQEDYIVAHPELEAEFSEKHPQFIKALLNEKRMRVKALNEPQKSEIRTPKKPKEEKGSKNTDKKTKNNSKKK